MMTEEAFQNTRLSAMKGDMGAVTALAKELTDLRKERAAESMYAHAWQREIVEATGGALLRKSHHIDSLVLTTQEVVSELLCKRAQSEGRPLPPDFVYILHKNGTAQANVFKTKKDAELAIANLHAGIIVSQVKPLSYKDYVLSKLTIRQKEALGIVTKGE